MDIGRCHVVLRETLDWERTTYDDLVSPFIRDIVRLWDETFWISFRTCRARGKAIAQDAHRSLLDHTGTLQLADISGLGPEDVLLPCDDDDWYHPEVLEHIHTAGVLRTGLLLWPDGVYGYRARDWHVERVAFRALDDASAVSGAIKTNNYAVTVALARREPGLLRHSTAVELFKTRRPVYQALQPALSLVNRHPCSITVWMSNVAEFESAAERVVALQRIVARYLEREIDTSQSAFRWAMPHLAQVRDVFREAAGL